MNYLRVARIVKPIGLSGELKIFSTTTFKKIRYKKGNTLFIKINDEYISFTVKSFKVKDAKFDAIQFNEITTLDEAEKYINLDIFCIEDKNVLKKNEFYYHDLEGLNAIDENKNDVGTVLGIEEFPANLTLKIEYKDKIYYVPFNDIFIKNVDLDKKEITIHMIDGLI